MFLIWAFYFMELQLYIIRGSMYLETDSEKNGQEQKLTTNEKSTIFELSS